MDFNERTLPYLGSPENLMRIQVICYLIEKLGLYSLSPAALHQTAPSCSSKETGENYPPDIFQTDPLSANAEHDCCFAM